VGNRDAVAVHLLGQAPPSRGTFINAGGGLLEPTAHRYLPLDGLRSIAIAAVFWFHYRVQIHSAGEWGWAGVDLFFALSGYLITGILYDSLHKPGYFRNFYMRRALRIFPLYWGLWIVLIGALLIRHHKFDPWYLAWPAYLGNYVDLHAIHAGLPHGKYDILAIWHVIGEKFYVRVGPYWSLAVEEQYYLLWPLVVWWVRDRSRLLRICAGGMVFILLLRTALHFWMPAAWVADNELYVFTFTRADTLLAGAIIALWARGPRGLAVIRTGWVMTAGILAACGLLVSAHRWGIFNGSTFAPWLQTYGYSLVGLLAACILVASLRVEWFARALAFKPLVRLGQVSYGFYIFHLLFYDCDRIPIDATHSPLVHDLIHIGIFGVVWALSWLSFRYFETPFLQLKERWGDWGRKTPVLAAKLEPLESDHAA
jgi:peptidoglycan/LPS O-acetylase OafA/YrhL